MFLSFSSFLASLIFGSILIVFLILLLKTRVSLTGTGLNILMIFTILIAFRFLVPLNFSFSGTIFSRRILTFLHTFFFEVRLTGSSRFSLYFYQLFAAVWITGSLWLFLRLCFRHSRVSKVLHCLKAGSADKVTARILDEEKERRNITKEIKIIQSGHIGSPALFGLLQPVILMPAIAFKPQEIRYIIRHELAHYCRRDLWCKLFFEILKILYWWNPLVWVLSKEASAILELRADQTVIGNLDQKEQISYMECLIRIQALQTQGLSDSGVFLPFGFSSLLCRFNHMLGGKRQVPAWLLALSCFILLFLSCLFVFEPYYTDPEIERITCSSFPADSYMVKLEDGLYEFYMGGQGSTTVANPYTEEFKDIPVRTDSSDIKNGTASPGISAKNLTRTEAADWKYISVGNRLHRRLYDHTRHRWISGWIPC